MATKPLPSQEVLRQLLDYDPETGAFFRRSNGKRADRKTAIGYQEVWVCRNRFYAHRLAWVWVYGEHPDHIDHADGQRDNNAVKNLRNVSKAENALNKRASRRNSSGVTGVIWHKGAKKWRAEIQKQGERQFLGLFTDIKDAAKAREEAEQALGFHKNHGV